LQRRCRSALGDRHDGHRMGLGCLCWRHSDAVHPSRPTRLRAMAAFRWPTKQRRHGGIRWSV